MLNENPKWFNIRLICPHQGRQIYLIVWDLFLTQWNDLD
jgi:hypothetical protein